ncbi:hypothetical protein BSKO_11386 [Bryopsis sp. KO-2023]|nr:hypothetical protein BSKO_11386 [Bryopsis sp. KO-2023]
MIAIRVPKLCGATGARVIVPSRLTAVRRARTGVRMQGLGQDVVGGWFDVAKLVAKSSEDKSPYGELADRLGRDVYIDINGWHLYLRDITVAENTKMHNVLATKLGPELSSGRFDEVEIEQFLRQVPIKLGGGKLKVRLTDALPSYPMEDFMKICKDFADGR